MKKNLIPILLFFFSSLSAPKSKPCLVNRVRTLSLETTSSNDEGELTGRSSPSSSPPVIRRVKCKLQTLTVRQKHVYTRQESSSIPMEAGDSLGATAAAAVMAPIGNNSPRLGERITLVVDETRFIVNPDLFRSRPDTMLGR